MDLAATSQALARVSLQVDRQSIYRMGPLFCAVKLSLIASFLFNHLPLAHRQNNRFGVHGNVPKGVATHNFVDDVLLGLRHDGINPSQSNAWVFAPFRPLDD